MEQRSPLEARPLGLPAELAPPERSIADMPGVACLEMGALKPNDVIAVADALEAAGVPSELTFHKYTSTLEVRGGTHTTRGIMAIFADPEAGNLRDALTKKEVTAAPNQSLSSWHDIHVPKPTDANKHTTLEAAVAGLAPELASIATTVANRLTAYQTSLTDQDQEGLSALNNARRAGLAKMAEIRRDPAARREELLGCRTMIASLEADIRALLREAVGRPPEQTPQPAQSSNDQPLPTRSGPQTAAVPIAA